MARRRRSRSRTRSRRRSSFTRLLVLLVWVVVGVYVLALAWMGIAHLLRTNVFVGMLLTLLVLLALGGGIGGFVWWRIRRRAQVLARIRTRNDLLRLTPTQFEHAVMELLRAWGYRDLRHTGGGGDLAADITGRTPDGAQAVVVQCKRYAPGHTVGSPEVQMFIGMLAVHHRAQVGMYVTTSSYTQPALALGQQHHLRMIDGAQLAASIQQMNAQRQPA